MSSHVANAFASEVSALFRSAGRSCTTPPEISFLLRTSLLSVLAGVRNVGEGGIRNLERSRAPIGQPDYDRFVAES